MPYIDPANLPSPNADLFREGEYPPVTKLETASETTPYEYERRGARLETATAISYNHGEFETREEKGLYYQVRVQVTTATDSYQAPVVLLDLGAGVAGAAPVIGELYQESRRRRLEGEHEVDAFKPSYTDVPTRPTAFPYSQQDVAVYQDGQPVKETALDFSFYGQHPWYAGGGSGSGGYDGHGIVGGSGFYRPETAQPLIPEQRIALEQEEPEEIVDDDYLQLYQDYLDYLAALEPYNASGDPYGGYYA